MASAWPAQAGENGPGHTFREGKRPVPLSMPFLARDGRHATLADFKGKVVVLNFWATWCEPCVEEMPALARFYGDFKAEGLELIPLAQDFKGFESVNPFLARHKLEGIEPYWDRRNRLFSAFGIMGLPATVFIDREGREVGRVTGFIDWDDEKIRKFIRTLL